MRILFLAPHPFFQHRGTPLAERALLEVVTAAGHDVEVVTFAEGDDVDLPRCRIVRIPRIPGLQGIRPGFSFKKLAADVALLWRSVQRARQWRPDLVHAVEESAFMALIIKAAFSVPYVYDMDSSLAEQLIERYGWLRPLARPLEAAEALIIRHSLAVLAVCPALEELAHERGPGVLTACIEDATLISESVAERVQASAVAPGAHPGQSIVMYVGNLEPYQGIDLLLESMAWALRHGAAARLVIVGGVSADVERYRAMAERLGVAGSVEFVGRRPVSELGDWLERADVLVSPRLGGRNTPMKIYSYLDSLRPIVATRVLTHTQVLDDSIAVLAEPTPESFGRALRDLVGDPARGTAVARRARVLVRERYTPERTAQKVSRLYLELARRIARQTP